jgi:hypothetical protein
MHSLDITTLLNPHNFPAIPPIKSKLIFTFSQLLSKPSPSKSPEDNTPQEWERELRKKIFGLPENDQQEESKENSVDSLIQKLPTDEELDKLAAEVEEEEKMAIKHQNEKYKVGKMTDKKDKLTEKDTFKLEETKHNKQTQQRKSIQVSETKKKRDHKLKSKKFEEEEEELIIKEKGFEIVVVNAWCQQEEDKSEQMKGIYNKISEIEIPEATFHMNSLDSPNTVKARFSNPNIESQLKSYEEPPSLSNSQIENCKHTPSAHSPTDQISTFS